MSRPHPVRFRTLAKSGPFSRRLKMEPLEDRRMLSVLFVDADAAAGGNGLAWASAYQDLQAALSQAKTLNGDADAANDVDQIWIAEGVYRPSAELEPGDARSASFSLVDGVTLYGGFEGTEGVLWQRDLDAGYETVLSGDIGVAGDHSDNAQSVVFCGEEVTATLDGLAIVEGNADGVHDSEHLERECGGGIFSLGTLSVMNSVVKDNSANQLGGGITSRGTLNVENSTIADNSAGDGGAIFHISYYSATVLNSTISGNSAQNSGGAVTNLLGMLTLIGSSVVDNRAGGGTNCTGGGVYNYHGYVTASDSIIVRNSVVGVARASGGGIYNDQGNVSVANCVLADNSAGGTEQAFGGGIYNDSGHLRVTNGTICRNVAREGGGICQTREFLTPDATLYNTIVAENAAIIAPDFYNDLGSVLGSYNLIGNGSDQVLFTDGVDGNLVGTPSAPIDPQLSSLTRLADGRWACYLLSGSPAIDAGSNELAKGLDGQPLSTDVYGNPRVVDGTVDIGAIEGITAGNSAQSYLVASLDDTIAEDGILTLAEALQAAGDNAPVGDAPAGSYSDQDVIRFADGLGGTISLGGSEMVVQDSVRIEGTGSENLTLDAEGLGRAISIRPGADVALSGMTITNGMAAYGGGILNFGSLAIEDFVISNCTAEGTDGVKGGAIYCTGSLSVANSEISGNAARGEANPMGGGIYCVGPLIMHDVSLTGNMVEGTENAQGGAVYCRFGPLEISDATFSGNSASGQTASGGAVYGSAEMTVADGLFVDNAAEGPGGGIFGLGDLTIVDSTFSGNSAKEGGAVRVGSATLSVANSSFFGNAAIQSGGGVYSSESSLMITNSCFVGNVAGWSGGGVRFGDSQVPGALTVTNSTFSGNEAQYGGGLLFSGINAAASVLNNSILAGNEASVSGPDYNGSGSLGGANNLIGDGSDQTKFIDGENGNIVGTAEAPANPFFRRAPSDGGDGWGDDPATPDVDESANDDFGDLRLLPLSPAIEAGDNGLVAADLYDMDADGDTDEPIPFDLDGSVRTCDGDADGTATVDMGAYEYFLDGPPVLLEIGAPSWVTEGDGTASATISVAEAPATDVTVYLYTSDATAITVPETVTLPAGQTSVPFDLGIVDDAELDGLQTATVTAAAVGHAIDSAMIDVRDDERIPTFVLYVDAGAADGGDGLSWETAFCDLQAALDEAELRDPNAAPDYERIQIWITEGTYFPSAPRLLNDPRTATFSLLDDVTLHGGFTGTETSLTERDWSTHETILSGDLGIVGDTVNNAYTVVYCGEDVKSALDGVSIVEGRADGDHGYNDYENDTGGGIYNLGTLLVTHATVERNWAGRNGGGIINSAGTLTLVNSKVAQNTADGPASGGGIYSDSGTLTVVNSQMLGNSAFSGGGISSCGNATVIVNSTIAGNRAVMEVEIGFAGLGGGIYACGNTTILNSTIAGNSIGEIGEGAGIYNPDGSLQMANSIVALNSEEDVLELAPGSANNLIGVDPRFVRNPGTLGPDDYGDLRLTAESPAIDAGDTGLLPDDTFDFDGDCRFTDPLPIDLAGAPRVFGESVDLGAYEYVAPTVPGDLNGDGFVGSGDLDLVRANWGQDVSPGDLGSGDASGDGKVGSADLDIVRANWGAGTPGAASAGVDGLVGDLEGQGDVYGPVRRGDAPGGRRDAVFANRHAAAEAAWAEAVEALRARRDRRDAAVVDAVLSEWKGMKG